MKPKQQKKVYATNSTVQWQPRKEVNGITVETHKVSSFHHVDFVMF